MTDHELLIQSYLSNAGGDLSDFFKEDVDVRSFYNRYDFYEKEDELLCKRFQRHFFVPKPSWKKEKVFKEQLSVGQIQDAYDFPIVVSEFGYVFVPNRYANVKKELHDIVFYCLGHKDAARIATMSVDDAIFRSKNLVRFDFSYIEGVVFYETDTHDKRFVFKRPPDMIVIEKLLDKNFTQKQLLAVDKGIEDTQKTWPAPEVRIHGSCVDFTFSIGAQTGRFERYTIKKGITPSVLSTFVVLRGRLPKENECDLLIEKSRRAEEKAFYIDERF